MDLNNIKIEDLKEKFAALDRKTLIKFGIGFGSIILFLIIYYAILSPMVDERKAKFEDKILKQQEIQQFEDKIINMRAKIKKLEPIVEKNSTLFHSKAEVEGLYKSLSRFAGAYGLVISKIEKEKEKPVLKDGVANQPDGMLKLEQVSYFKIPIHRTTHLTQKCDEITRERHTNTRNLGAEHPHRRIQPNWFIVFSSLRSKCLGANRVKTLQKIQFQFQIREKDLMMVMTS